MPQKPPPVKLSPQVLKRGRLFRLIEGARAGAGLWVAGMAGAGKTTLVASYLQENRFRSLWYPLDRRDGDLPNFFFHFGSELRKISHRVYRGMPHLTPEYLPGTESFVSGYFVKLFSRIETPLWMVFDNYQEVPPDSGFNLVLMSLFKFAPPGVMVVVISRDNPPPIMARLLATQKLALLDAGRLAFTESESRDLIRQLAGTPPSEEEVVRIHAVTRGWVAGIILLLLRPNQLSGFHLPDANQTPDEIFDFFGSEVFAKLENPDQEFLLKTALLPDLTPQLIDPFTGNPHSKAILEKLIRQNFFLERIGSAWRYHPLFRRFLLDRFSTRFPDQEARGLQRRAGELLVAAGRPEDAAPLYAQAEAWDGLVSLIRGQAPRVVSEGRLGILLSWIDLLPAMMVAGDAWLLHWRGLCTLPVDPEAGLQSCRSAYRLFADRADLEGCLISLSALLETGVWLNKPYSQMEEWINAGQKLLETVKSDLSQHPFENLTAGMLAALVLYSPADSRLAQWEELAHGLVRSNQGPGTALREWLLYLSCYRGEIDAARSLISWMTPILDQPDGTPSLLRWKIQECHYHISTGDGDQGILAAEEGLRLAEKWGTHQQDFAFQGHRIYFYLVKGDVLAARQGLKQLAQTVRPDSIAELAFYQHLACLEAFTSDDIERAKELALVAAGSAKLSGLNWLGVSTLFTLSRIHLKCGDPEPAAHRLAEVFKIADASCSRLIRTWALFAKADQDFSLGNTDQGLDALSHAFQFSNRKGALYHPALGRRTMSHLCAAALASDVDRQSVLNFIRELKLPAPEDPPACKLWPWPVRVYILGGFSVIRGHEPVSFPRKAQKRPLELLMMLACCGRRGETREKLADQLWPEAEGDMAEQTLSTTLHRLRKLLGPGPSILQENERMALSSQHCWVDAWHFEDVLTLAGKADGREKVQLLSEAVDLYRGNPRGDYPLIQAYSQLLQEKTLEALAALGDLHAHAGDFQQAVVCYRRGVLLSPTAEKFYQRLMRVLGTQGNRAEAAAVYERCRNTLQQHLGILPSKATTDLYRSILAN